MDFKVPISKSYEWNEKFMASLAIRKWSQKDNHPCLAWRSNRGFLFYLKINFGVLLSSPNLNSLKIFLQFSEFIKAWSFGFEWY